MAEIKIKHMPHVQVMAKKYAQNKEYILARLEMSSEAYHVMQFGLAEKWIREAMWNDDALTSQLMQMPDFWNWFINKWNIRDDEYFHHHFDAIVNPSTPVDGLRKRWHLAHQAQKVRGILPDEVLKRLFKWANGGN